MDYTGVGLIIAMFIVNAVALDCLYNNRIKSAGALNILSLCLIVALAYTFKQMGSIMTLFGILVACVVAFFVIRFFLKRAKDKKSKETESQRIEVKEGGEE